MQILQNLNSLCSPYADHCVQVTQCQGLPKLLTWPYAPDRAKRGTCGTQADYPYARDSSVGKHTDPNRDTSQIRTRFVPARRAVLLYAACTEKRKSTCWTWSNCDFGKILKKIGQNSSRSPWRASIQPIVADLSDRAAGQKKDPGRSEERKENGGAATGKLREIGKRKAAE